MVQQPFGETTLNLPDLPFLQSCLPSIQRTVNDMVVMKQTLGVYVNSRFADFTCLDAHLSNTILLRLDTIFCGQFLSLYARNIQAKNGCPFRDFGGKRYDDVLIA